MSSYKIYDKNEAREANEISNPMTGSRAKNLQKRANNMLRNFQEGNELQANEG